MSIPKALIKRLIKDFNKQPNDTEKLKYIISNKKYFSFFLANDYTIIRLSEIPNQLLTEEEIEDYNYSLNSFDDYLGNSYGVQCLLDALGISFEVA